MARAKYGSRVLERQSKEYRAWSNMITRCTNKKYELYHRYGGRGICVDESWIESYDNFLIDMGRAPTKVHTLDRRDNNSGYGKDNCRWATNKEQANNKSNNRIIEIDGVSKTLAQWCDLYKCDYAMTQRRLDLGWDSKEAFSKPKGYKRYSYTTPDGVFDDQYVVAEFYGIKLKTVSARFCSKTMMGWVKKPR